MIEGVLAWQAIIFVSIALGGRKRGWIVGFWVVWTLLQVFALWLSVIQFGTIWLAWSIFGSKTSSAVSAPQPPKLDPAVEAERLAKQKREDDEFQEAHRQWIGRVSGALGAGRWIPNGSVGRLLAKYPAPKHARKTWKQAVGESTPEETLRLQFYKLNAQHLARQKIARKDFFATVEKNPLTDEQIHACVCMDDAVMVVAADPVAMCAPVVFEIGSAARMR